MVPVAGLEPAHHRWQWILSYITHSESEAIKRTLSESVTLKKSPKIKGFRQLNVKKTLFCRTFLQLLVLRANLNIGGHSEGHSANRQAY